MKLTPTCMVCGRNDVRLTREGLLVVHKYPGSRERCPGSLSEPVESLDPDEGGDDIFLSFDEDDVDLLPFL